MASTRKIFAEFAAVFLIGTLVGGLLVYSFTDTQMTTFMKRWNNEAALEARINNKYANDYHFSPEEMAKIQPMIKQMAQDIFRIRHQFGMDVISKLNRDHAAIAAQLTPEHREAYEKRVAQRSADLSALLLGDQGSAEGGQK